MGRHIAHFLKDDDGAISVDFVILTAAVSIMALGAIAVIVAEVTEYGDVIAELIASALRS